MAQLTREDYLEAAIKLLPEGLAWQSSPDSELAFLLSLRAEPLAKINQTAHQLVSERILGNALILLEDWEAFYGLPECGSNQLTLADRRQALIAKDAQVGSFNRAYLEALARSQGYEIKVITHHPHHCLRHCVYPLHPIENAWRVFIYTTSKSVRNVSCLDEVNQELRLFERSKVECFLQKFCYSHLEMIFIYQTEGEDDVFLR